MMNRLILKRLKHRKIKVRTVTSNKLIIAYRVRRISENSVSPLSALLVLEKAYDEFVERELSYLLFATSLLRKIKKPNPPNELEEIQDFSLMTKDEIRAWIVKREELKREKKKYDKAVKKYESANSTLDDAIKIVMKRVLIAQVMIEEYLAEYLSFFKLKSENYSLSNFYTQAELKNLILTTLHKE